MDFVFEIHPVSEADHFGGGFAISVSIQKDAGWAGVTLDQQMILHPAVT